MELQPITITETKKENELEIFDGVFLHPSLDIKDNILVLGFRYRSKSQKEEEAFAVISKDYIQIVTGESFEMAGKTYHFEKRGRKLMRLDERWSFNGLQQFLNRFAELRVKVNGKQTFMEILELTKRYVELEQEIDYYLLSAWILGTYFFPSFYAFPFLHIKAPKRSGKSQCLNLLTQLCFNAIKARPSLAALSDTVDSLRGTYLIDQADSLGRKGSEELLDILADSYKKSGGKRRVIVFDKKKSRETVEFETYGPKAFASIKELPEDLRDRCLVIQLIRSQRNFADPDDNNENWRDIRGKIYAVLIADYDYITLQYAFKKALYRQNSEILGRSLELWLPFEITLECLGLTEKIQEAKTRFLSQYGFSEYEPSELEEGVIKALIQRVSEQPEVILTPKEIAESLDGDLFTSSDTAKQRAAKVGWALKKFNLATEKKSRTKDGMRYRFEKSRVETVYQSYFKTADETTPLTPTENKDELEAMF